MTEDESLIEGVYGVYVKSFRSVNDGRKAKKSWTDVQVWYYDPKISASNDFIAKLSVTWSCETSVTSQFLINCDDSRW